MPETDPQPQHKSTLWSTTWRIVRAIWRRIENLVFGFVSLLILLYFLLQMPTVQNWLLRHATAYCTDLVGSKVEIRHIDLAFFDNIVLDGVYVEDHRGDTLLYAEHLSAGLSTNFFSALYNKLYFDEVELRKARINIRRPEGSYDSNLDELLAKLPKSAKKEKNPNASFLIKLRRFRLEDVAFLSEDQVSGQTIRGFVAKGLIQANALDIPAKIVDIATIKLDRVGFYMEENTRHPLPPRAAKPKSDTSKSIVKALVGKIGRLEINEATFKYDKFRSSPRKQTAERVFDKNHIYVTGIGMAAKDIRFDDAHQYSGEISAFSAKEQCGIELRNSFAKSFVVTDSLTALYGARIETPASTLGDTIRLEYSGYADYLHFEDSVRLDLRLREGSKLRLGDIPYFSGALDRNKFFDRNRELVADISGHYYGTVSKKLRGDKMLLRIGNSTVVAGSLRAEALTGASDQSRLEFKFDRLQTDFTTLARIIPGFKPPSALNALGNSITYEGDYQLFYGFDHIIHGKLNTGIGSGTLDLNLDLKDGLSKAIYSGALNMQDVNLGAYYKDFGKTSFRVNIAPGSTGLTLASMRANMEGNIDYLEYKGYKYQNVRMDGSFKEYVFDGKMAIKDPNIVFNFDGNVNLRDSIPQFLFDAQLTRLDVGALNLLDEDWIVSGNIEQMRLSGTSWRDLNGTAALKNIRILEIGENENITHQIDSLRFVSAYHADGTNAFSVRSSLLDGDLTGRFDLTKVGKNLVNLFSRYHPEWAGHLGLPAADSIEIADQFELKLQIHDLKDLPSLFKSPVDSIFDIPIYAKVDGPKGQSQLDLQVPEAKFGSVTLQNIKLKWYALKDNAQVFLDIPSGRIAKSKLAPINIQGFLSRDEFEFSLNAEDSLSTGIVKAVNLNAVLQAVDSSWQVKFNASDIALLNENWTVSNKNYIRFRKNYLETKDFEFFSGNRRILIDSINGGSGIKLSLTNFGMDFANRFISEKKAKFEGNIYDFEVSIGNLFKMQQIHAGLGTDMLRVNGIPYGAIDAYVDMDSLRSMIVWDAFLNYKNQKAQIGGAYLPTGLEARRLESKDLDLLPGEMKNRVVATDFPMEVLETFISGISQTKGQIDADVVVGGPLSRIGMKGEAWVTGQTQLNYLKASFIVDSQRVELSDYRIWATGGTIWDGSPTRLHSAKVRGGIKHDHFKKWELDCDVRSQDRGFLVMRTQKEDNPLYYGTARGSFDARFRGSFVRTNITVDAVTGRDTKLFIPLTSTSDIGEVKFITFNKKDQKDTVKTNQPTSVSTDLKGLNFEMNLSMTPEAEVQLIFDEQAGDIIVGRGDGDLKMQINREGEFKMYGGYNISSGEYLFTLLSIVNKPFKVKQGGTINWFGDPYSAQINLDATYEESTAPYNFIQDEILTLGNSDPEVASTANNNTRVLVTMHLKGELFKPDITFDLEFPNLTGKLKTLTDNHLRLVRQDQNELSRQVFGLIVAGNFLPSGNQFVQGSDYTASAVNTLTQMLSSQFSRYITDLVTPLLGGTFSTINFNVAYNENANASTIGSIVNQSDREVRLRLSGGLKNDRILFQVGSQIGIGRPGTDQNNFFGEDVVIEFIITKNRHWRLKVFQRLEPGYDGGRRNSFGTGLSFRKDYESFDEMSKGVRNWFRVKRR